MKWNHMVTTMLWFTAGDVIGTQALHGPRYWGVIVAAAVIDWLIFGRLVTQGQEA